MKSSALRVCAVPEAWFALLKFHRNLIPCIDFCSAYGRPVFLLWFPCGRPVVRLWPSCVRPIVVLCSSCGSPVVVRWWSIRPSVCYPLSPLVSPSLNPFSCPSVTPSVCPYMSSLDYPLISPFVCPFLSPRLPSSGGQYIGRSARPLPSSLGAA